MPTEEVAENIFLIPVFNPFGALDTNAYLLRGERLGLLDPGPKHGRSREDLEEGLNGLGCRPEDVDVVLLSHGHADHYGMAHLFPWAEVLVGRRDLGKTVDLPAHMRSYEAAVRRLLPGWAVPPESAETILEFFARLLSAGGSVPWAAPLDEGSRLEGFGGSLEVVETPGHTEGLVCLYRVSDQVLLSADHLLETIIPNPGLYALEDPPGNGLADYVASVRKLEPLAVRLVLPGHGRPFSGFPDRLKEILAEGERRLEETRTALGEGVTVYEMARKLFAERDWGNGYFAFVVLLETCGRLGLLLDRGLAVSDRVGEADLYYPGA
jgi:glyoxylase-like metal-dependent hydrolase (beta-lactamase superfamily II)